MKCKTGIFQTETKHEIKITFANRFCVKASHTFPVSPGAGWSVTDDGAPFGN